MHSAYRNLPSALDPVAKDRVQLCLLCPGLETQASRPLFAGCAAMFRVEELAEGTRKRRREPKRTGGGHRREEGIKGRVVREETEHNSMSELTTKPKSELSQNELQDLEDYEFNNGPLRVLAQAVQNSDSVLISLRNSHKLVARVKAFDRHCNMVLENVKEFWYEEGQSQGDAKSRTKAANKVLRERFVSKMFLRGDSVVVVLKFNGD